MPIVALKNHHSPFVYTAQVKSRRQIDKQVETAKTRSFFESKKWVSVGTKVYAQTSAESTTKNHDSVWFTARLQIKQAISATI